jgi:putative membrane protein
MKSIFSRAMLVSAIMSVFVLQVYAHHGAQFLNQAMEMNTAEVQLGKMAATKAQDSRVRNFAEMMVKDHNQALDKIRTLWDDRSKATGNHSRRNDQINAEHKRVSQRLNKLSGADFDREYMTIMVREHRAALRAFELQSHAHGYGRNSNTSANVNYMKDTDTAAFASEMLPTIRQHLQRAEEIQKEMRGTTTTQ